MQNQLETTLKPALILGSGFHRHVFGEGADRGNRACLVDWHTLVGKTAQKMQIAVPSMAQTPVLRWESMIICAARDGYLDCDGQWKIAGEGNNSSSNAKQTKVSRVEATNRIEKRAKRVAAGLLQEVGKDYPHSLRAKIPADVQWGCVISMNFDTAWRPGLQPSDFQPHVVANQSSGWKCITSIEKRRLSWSGGQVKEEERPCPSRLWFPNGTVLDPETIRMRLHDYGNAPAGIQSAFNKLKAWERNNSLSSMPVERRLQRITMALNRTSDPDPPPSLDTFLKVPAEEKANVFPLTWVAEFLYRPLVFAGVGLTDQESGLWWLLAQRARNLARVRIAASGSVRILMRRANGGRGDSDREAFWATRPFGIEPVYCDDWVEGWDRIVEMAPGHPHQA